MYVADSVSTLTFDSDVLGEWNLLENAADLEIEVDNHANGSSLGAGFTQGWRVQCVSSTNTGRLDLHQVYVRYTES
jgi:hypothetical protein